MLCADVVEVLWTGPQDRPRHATAVLEDISTHGACLQLEVDLPLGTEVSIVHAKVKKRGTVRYCTYREIGFFAGVEFPVGSEWSQNEFEPEHLLDPRVLVERRVKKASGQT